MDRDTLTQNMLRAGRQWAVCVAMGDYDEARMLADEITGYSAALDRLDLPTSVSLLTGMSREELDEVGGFRSEWDVLKGSPDTSRLGAHG